MCFSPETLLGGAVVPLGGHLETSPSLQTRIRNLTHFQSGEILLSKSKLLPFTFPTTAIIIDSESLTEYAPFGGSES